MDHVMETTPYRGKHRTICGIKIVPQWPWSDGYALHLRRMLSGNWRMTGGWSGGDLFHIRNLQNCREAREHQKIRIDAYRAWLAQRDGVEPDSPHVDAIMQRHWRCYYSMPQELTESE